jgi:hypothetical protein
MYHLLDAYPDMQNYFIFRGSYAPDRESDQAASPPASSDTLAQPAAQSPGGFLDWLTSLWPS